MNGEMLISIRRRRHRSRDDDLRQLRDRFSQAPTTGEACAETIAKARRLRAMRGEMAQLLAEVDACQTCSRGRSGPGAHWDGGYCCGSRTLHIFTVEEVAQLKLGGTTPRDLVPPQSEQAGCAFRGATGCSLSPENRPTICLRYMCTELTEELRKQPRWQRITRLSRAMFNDFPDA